MESDMYMQLKLKYNTFTNAYKRLADFVINNPEFVLHKSISDVASACDVGEATISRFCKLLGYKGYHDFKLSIVQYISKDSETGEITATPITRESTIDDIANSILQKDIESINETRKIINSAQIEDAVNMLCSAKRIMFFGMGSSFTAALEACNKFMRITPKAIINIEAHMQYISASLMSPDDVAVIISYSGSTKEIVEIARTAKSRGAKIICITKYLKSPLTHYSDITLIVSSNERDVHGYSLSMEFTQIYLLDVLYTAYFLRNYDESQSNRSDAASFFQDKFL